MVFLHTQAAANAAKISISIILTYLAELDGRFCHKSRDGVIVAKEIFKNVIKSNSVQTLEGPATQAVSDVWGKVAEEEPFVEEPFSGSKD